MQTGSAALENVGMVIRTALLLTVAIASFAESAPVMAGTPHQLGDRMVETASDTAGPVPYLLTARTAAKSGRYGQTSDALGRAETRLLNDASATPDRAPPFLQRALSDVVAARAGAARGQRIVTIEAINDALLALAPRPLASATDPAPSLAPVKSAIAQPAPLSMQGLTPSRPPPELWRLEPGHWQWSGPKSVWVNPQIVPQRV